MHLYKRLDIPPAVKEASIKDNERFSHYVLYILIGIIGACILYNVALLLLRYTRTLVCLRNDNQLYFASPEPLYAKIKQHLLYAPLGSHRHSEPARIWRFSIGLVPWRLQFLLFLGIIVMNITLATYSVEWHKDEMTKLFHFRNRLGTLALTNIIQLVLLAGRNNPLIYLTKISFDTFNLVHRWFGHLVIALAFAHGVVEFYFMDGTSKKYHKDPVENFGHMLKGEEFLMFSFVVSTIPSTQDCLLAEQYKGFYSDAGHLLHNVHSLPLRLLRNIPPHTRRSRSPDPWRTLGPPQGRPTPSSGQGDHSPLGNRTLNPVLHPRLPQSQSRRYYSHHRDLAWQRNAHNAPPHLSLALQTRPIRIPHNSNHRTLDQPPFLHRLV